MKIPHDAAAASYVRNVPRRFSTSSHLGPDPSLLVSPRLASTFYLFQNTRYIRCPHFVRPRRMARKYKKSGWGRGGIGRASGQGLVFRSSPGETTTAHSCTERTVVTGVYGVLGGKGGVEYPTLQRSAAYLPDRQFGRRPVCLATGCGGEHADILGIGGRRQEGNGGRLRVSTSGDGWGCRIKDPRLDIRHQPRFFSPSGGRVYQLPRGNEPRRELLGPEFQQRSEAALCTTSSPYVVVANDGKSLKLLSRCDTQ